nr:hypothetical protein BHI3_09410 [Bacteriovorax sp. HI3]
MKKSLFLLFILSSTSSHADFGDSIAKAFFQKKVEHVYEKALQCDPLEKDPKSGMDAKDWIKIQPTLPGWQMLAEIEKVANEANSFARSKKTNDKIRHCLAGCYIAQKLDYQSAVLVGWYKELQDASDCSKNTSFEKKDYEATIFGARGADSEKGCERFCKK